jgi:hypothetical protein
MEKTHEQFHVDKQNFVHCKIDIPTSAIFTSNLCVQTGSGAHPASCTMGTEGPFSGGKAQWGVMLTTHPI